MAESTSVIDSSAILNLLLPDEETSDIGRSIDARLKKGESLIAPKLLCFEVGNALRTGVLRKRLTKSQAEELFGQFLLLDIRFLEVNYLEVLKQSVRSGLSYYDAAYLWLAQKKGVELLTLDTELLAQVEGK